MNRTFFFHRVRTLVFPPVLCCFLYGTVTGQHQPFHSNETLTWEECITAYEKLDAQFEEASLVTSGTTDIGKPLHMFVINADKQFYPELFDRRKTILLINNAIHPGEPDGVDASLRLCEELLNDHGEMRSLLDSVILCIIPIYNVDGALNRGSHSRANQDGPQEYGFRGNARNLDLNRDFIKCDSQNARSFTQIFRRIDPDVFVDTHVSNGADYPYTMTLISTQSDKLGERQGTYLREQFTPALFDAMKIRGQEMCPYVNTMGRHPESGLSAFLESPRFASGYAALFGTFAFITETHMLKPFPQRVESTYQFLLSLLGYCHSHTTELRSLRILARNDLEKQREFFLSWNLDTLQHELIPFNGYQARNMPSAVGTGQREFYDRDQPWSDRIHYYNRYRGAEAITCPKTYILPQAWREVADRLRWNGVIMNRLEKDTVMVVTARYIDEFDSPDKPYEGHFMHSRIRMHPEQSEIQFFAGDYIIPLQQDAKRYLIEVLEPQGADSFLAWNFFDSVLQQKEWFSDYVFEDKAAELLARDPVLKREFEEALTADPELQQNHWNQLYWIYKRSPYYEKSAFRYPVYSID